MASTVDFSSLLPLLNRTGLQQKQQPLYQLLTQLINRLMDLAPTATGTTNNNTINNITNNDTFNNNYQFVMEENDNEETVYSMALPTPIIINGSTMVTNEVPTGSINGSNKLFTTTNTFNSGTLLVYLNGVRQRLNDDYTETSSNTFTFTQAPLTGDLVTVDYNFNGVAVGPPGPQGTTGATGSAGATGSQGIPGPGLISTEEYHDDLIVQILGGGSSSSSSTPLGTLLEEHTASGATSIPFTSRNALGQSGATFNTDYDTYLFVFTQIIIQTNATHLLLNFSSNGGVSYDTGTNYGWGLSQFDYNFQSTGGVGAGGNSGQTSIRIFHSAGNTTNYSISGFMKLFNPLGSIYKQIISDLTSLVSDGNIYRDMGTGHHLVTTSDNACEFTMSSGTISGTIRCYGIGK